MSTVSSVARVMRDFIRIGGLPHGAVYGRAKVGTMHTVPRAMQRIRVIWQEPADSQRRSRFLAVVTAGTLRQQETACDEARSIRSCLYPYENGTGVLFRKLAHDYGYFSALVILGGRYQWFELQKMKA